MSHPYQGPRASEIDAECRDHVLRLLGTWSVLSDLSFSDLLLLTPQDIPGGVALEVIGQVRPATSATLVRSDLVGESLRLGDWPSVAKTLENGETEWGQVNLAAFATLPTGPGAGGEFETGQMPALGDEASLECVPVRCGQTVAAALVRVSTIEQRRRPGRLERTYHQLYQRLVSMVAAGSFPFAGEVMPAEDAPRVGDGLMVVDTDSTIRFASPNATSALHRMGVTSSVDGRTLLEMGVEEGAVDYAMATGNPVVEEIERRPDVVVLIQCIPLLDGDDVTGGMVLLRDVTDLRRRDRLLLTKDAAIREVHHRVKNNLQTISSLLRLQARRLDPGEGQQALREAERRVRSIAVVHEILSRDPGEEVPFDEIVGSLVKMAEDSVVGSDQIEIRVTGDLGDVTAGVATPLAVVIAELIQNAIEHGFPHVEAPAGAPIETAPATATRSGSIGHIDLVLGQEGSYLRVQVHDDGVGLPPGFDIAKTNSLGLSIVRDLVETQLSGTISMVNRGGTLVDISVLTSPSEEEHAW
ncbi:MAG: histidine kinase N-terminal domain-containing protein [Acidimicrobiales bacterium]